MLACKNKRIVMVRSILDLASHGFLDIDAVDNSGETALIKAKKRNFLEIVVLLLKFKFISAVKDKNTDTVKSMLSEFHSTLDIFVKSWSSNKDFDDMSEERKTKSDIWLEAVYIAMENYTKHSEEILNLLLDCDILLGQEIKTGYSSFSELVQGWEVDYDKKLCLIKLLLQSGKINANDRDEYGRTAIHMAEEEKLMSLLIRYGADVSRKDNKGKTPLMPYSGKRDIERFPVLRTLLEEAGTLGNLDAMDCNGRTALMHAVMSHRPHDVEFLLNKGASVNLSDHLGFTALHHALHGNINELFRFPRNAEELKKLKEMAILFDAEKYERRVWRSEEWSEERRKIVEMLLQRPDIDVNLLSIEMFSPLDIAERQIPEIPSSIKDALKEKDAVLNVFRQTSDFHLDFTCKLTWKQFVKTINACGPNNFRFPKERWLALIETFKQQLVSGKYQQGRTALHLAVISFYSSSLVYNNHGWSFVKTIVKHLISLGCSVNETDNFGRTPLHYANAKLWKLLIYKGADASIKDKDGNCAMDKTSQESSTISSDIVRAIRGQKEIKYFVRIMNNKQVEIRVQCVLSQHRASDYNQEEATLKTVLKLLWGKGRYAFRHPLVDQITKNVRDLMDATAKEMERLDPRFKIKPILVGSSNEGTKLDKPNEFDFCFVLKKIGELCEVSQSPELSTGFVRLKRNTKKVDETSDLDSFFRKDRVLSTDKLILHFTTILHNAISNIERQQSLEWNLELWIEYTRISDNIKKVLNIQMIKPLNFFTVDTISVDIVPCIHVDDWWPDEAISNVSDEIKNSGCNLVFDRPQELYPWVPYSECCARISFAKAESDMIKQSCDNAREAYMIGKMMMMIEESTKFSKYIMKNCLLYCIEALSPSSDKAFELGLSLEVMKSKFNQMDRYLWLKCLLKCHLEFVAQDFCPCYFLPTFSNCSLIEDKLHYLKKVSYDWITDHGSTFPLSCKDACALYRCTSNHISEASYQLPAPDPLWERFDRKQLIASLFEIAYK